MLITDYLIAPKEYRKKAKLTQRQLAKRAKVSQSVISEIENGNRNVLYSTIIKILNTMEKCMNT